MRLHALTTHLLEGARLTAYRAIDNLDSDDEVLITEAAVSAGISLELFLKAVTSHVAPALVVTGVSEEQRAQTMVRLQLSESIDVEWMLDQKSASFAFSRAAAIAALPELKPLYELMGRVMEGRNAASHMLLSSKKTLRESVTTLGRASEVILKSLESEEAAFWGTTRLELLRSLREENASAVRQSVAQKLLTASNYLTMRLAGLSKVEQRVVVAALEKQGSPFFSPNITIYRTACPACKHSAEVWVRAADYDDGSPLEIVDVDEDGIPTGFLMPQEAVSAQVACPVCGLQLTPDEIAFAYPELTDLWELEPRVMSLEEYDDRTIMSDHD